MLSSSSDTHKSFLPSSSCCRTLFCPRISVNPSAGSVAMRVFELTVPVWETWSFFQSVILMTAKLRRENGERETARKQTVLCWSPCKVSENHHPFCWKGHFQWKIVLSVFFFCPALFCEFLVPFLYAPALPCGLACCLPSKSWSYAWWTQCIADMQGGVTSREREQEDKCFLMGCGNWGWGIFILQCPGDAVQAFPGKMADRIGRLLTGFFGWMKDFHSWSNFWRVKSTFFSRKGRCFSLIIS